MEAILNAYYGVLDAYHVIAPWLPLQLNASMQSLYSQSLTILHTLLTNPSALSTMIPQIISTLVLFISVWWTISSVYHTARRGFRILSFLLRYGTVVAAILGGLGYISTDAPRGDVTLPGSILEGIHTVMNYFDVDLPVGLEAFMPHIDLQPQAPAPPHGPRKPWAKFANLANDNPASNTRSKSSKKKSRRRKGEDEDEDANPFGDISMTDALHWFNNLRQGSPLASSNSEEDGSHHSESTFERKLRQMWENKDAWHSADDFLNAFKLPKSGSSRGGNQDEEGDDLHGSTSESR